MSTQNDPSQSRLSQASASLEKGIKETLRLGQLSLDVRRWKSLLPTENLESFQKQLKSYESRVRKVVKELDSVSREVRREATAVGQANLEKLRILLQESRTSFEKNIRASLTDVLQREGEKLNRTLNSIYDRLSSARETVRSSSVASQASSGVAKPRASTKKASSRGTVAGTSKKTSAKKKRQLGDESLRKSDH